MMRVETQIITPEIASLMLVNNYKRNRNIRSSWVEVIAESMKNGEFNSMNGQTITVDEHGTLCDGQHRLSAIIKSGIAFPFIVVTVDDADTVYKTIDNGAKRNAADFINGNNKTAAAALAKIAVAIERGEAPLKSSLQGKKFANLPVSRVEIVDYANAHEREIQEYVKLGNRIGKSIGAGSRNAYSTALFIIDYCKRGDKKEPFVNDICDEFTTSVTCREFTKRIRKAYLSNKSSPKFDWIVGIMLDAYDHYVKNDRCVAFNKTEAKIARYSKLIEEQRILRGRQ